MKKIKRQTRGRKDIHNILIDEGLIDRIKNYKSIKNDRKLKRPLLECSEDFYL